MQKFRQQAQNQQQSNHVKGAQNIETFSLPTDSHSNRGIGNGGDTDTTVDNVTNRTCFVNNTSAGTSSTSQFTSKTNKRYVELFDVAGKVHFHFLSLHHHHHHNHHCFSCVLRVLHSKNETMTTQLVAIMFRTDAKWIHSNAMKFKLFYNEKHSVSVWDAYAFFCFIYSFCCKRNLDSIMYASEVLLLKIDKSFNLIAKMIKCSIKNWRCHRLGAWRNFWLFENKSRKSYNTFQWHRLKVTLTTGKTISWMK